ncbi:MAG: LPP20 family lipoprotein [Parashewanella sp.]
MKVFAILLVLLMSGCSAFDRHVQWQVETPESFPKLTAIGYAALSKQSGKSKSEKVLKAMQASKVDAYRELAEQVYGQKVTAVSDVHEWKLEHSETKTSVSGIIRGAKVVKGYLEGDFYVTELELDYQQVWALSQQRNKTRKIKKVTYF